MATRNKLREVSPETLAKLANQGGQKAAAETYGVTQASVSRKLTAAQYRPVTVWVAPNERVTVESAS